MLERKFNKPGDIPDSFIQHLQCVNLETVTQLDTCKILRSTVKLPNTIGGNANNTLVSVYAGSGNSAVFFTESSAFRQRTNQFNRFTSKARRWFLQDGYLYITNEHLMETISVSGVFEDPDVVNEFCETSNCFDPDAEYPVSNKMAYEIVNIILKERFNIVHQMPTDEHNNATQSPKNDN